MRIATTVTFAHEDGSPHHLRRPYEQAPPSCTTMQGTERVRMAIGECADCSVKVLFTPTPEELRWVRAKERAAKDAAPMKELSSGKLL